MHERSAAVGRATYPQDPDFPQLEIASDPGQMLEVFRMHLKPASRTVLHIQECRPFRFRYRQSGSRCVLQYTLRVVEPSTGRQWDQWVTGLVYAQKGEAERLWRQMDTADPRRKVAEGWLTFEPVGFIPPLEMLVQVFPYDRRLPQLGLVLAGGLRGLDPLLLARLAPGQWEVVERNIEPTRYRTELGAALRYTIQARETSTASRETLRCYLKVYRNERGAETFRLLRALCERTGAAAKGFGVARPIAYLSEERTLVLEEAPGDSLQQVLLEGHETEGAVRAVARAVAAFHQDDLPTARQHSLADQLEDVRRAATLLQWACPGMRGKVYAIVAAVAGGLREAPAAPIHRDLKPDHIFLSGDRVSFIDCDGVALGDPVRDPAHLFAHLTARVGLDAMPRDRARLAATTLREAYFAHVPEPWVRRFALHCAGALVEVAGGIVKRQEEHWPEKVTAAIEEAAALASLR